MPKQKADSGMKSTSLVRGGRGSPKTEKYAAGWLAHPDKPEEDLIRLGGFAWSELYVGTQTKRIYKCIKNTGEWFRFAFVMTEEAKADLG